MSAEHLPQETALKTTFIQTMQIKSSLIAFLSTASSGSSVIVRVAAFLFYSSIVRLAASTFSMSGIKSLFSSALNYGIGLIEYLCARSTRTLSRWVSQHQILTRF